MSASTSSTTPSFLGVTASSSCDVTTPSSCDVTTPPSQVSTTPSYQVITTPSSCDVTAPSSCDVTAPSSHDVTTLSSHDVTALSSHDVTAPSFQASSMAQNEKVEFDSSYKKGTVYVFPPIIKSRVKVFKKTEENFPQDPLMPRPEEKHAMLADQAKMDSGQDKLKGEEAEACVVTMLYQQLQKAARPDDPPAFIFTSLQLQGCEKDVIIYHEKHGIIIVEIKAIEDIGTAAAPRSRSTLVKAAVQLEKARDAMTSELQGLLACPPKLLVALPNLQGVDPQDVRQRVKFFRDNPDVVILCGGAVTDFEAWLQQLSTQSDPLVWEARPDSHQAFVTAVSRHLSVEPFSPSQTVSALAQVHRNWLLTPDQAPILHCQDPLIHLWGPPGAGKTLLLVHRAKLWLQEGRSVILAVGQFSHSVLLQHLGRTVVNGQGATVSHRLRLCRHYTHFDSTVEEVRGQGSDIVVVVDEVHTYILSIALNAFHNKQITSLWSAGVTDIPDTMSERFFELGGQRILLPYSIRCPPSVVQVAGKLQQATTTTPAMEVFPCLPARLPTASVKVTLHPSHPHYRKSNPKSPHFDCGVCSKWLKSSLSPLVEGLPPQHPQWQDWVIVCTGNLGMHAEVTAILVESLLKQGIPAVREMEIDWDASNIPVTIVQSGSVSQGSNTRDEKAAWRERVVAGIDRDGHTAVHLVDYDNFLGLEKAGVLVLHWDSSDDDPQQQSQKHVDARMAKHREALFYAVTRSQSELAVWLLSPSPAVSFLLLSQEEIEQRRRQEKEERQRKEEEERQIRDKQRKRQEEEGKKKEKLRRKIEEYKQHMQQMIQQLQGKMEELTHLCEQEPPGVQREMQILRQQWEEMKEEVKWGGWSPNEAERMQRSMQEMSEELPREEKEIQRKLEEVSQMWTSLKECMESLSEEEMEEWRRQGKREEKLQRKVEEHRQCLGQMTQQLLGKMEELMHLCEQKPPGVQMKMGNLRQRWKLMKEQVERDEWWQYDAEEMQRLIQAMRKELPQEEEEMQRKLQEVSQMLTSLEEERQRYLQTKKHYFTFC